MPACRVIQRKNILVSHSAQSTQTGLAYMHETHGTSPGHVCSDCQALMRNSHCTTICACKEYPFRGSMMTDHRDGNGWRGHWLACGLWRLAYRARKAEQLEIALED